MFKITKKDIRRLKTVKELEVCEGCKRTLIEILGKKYALPNNGNGIVELDECEVE